MAQQKRARRQLENDDDNDFAEPPTTRRRTRSQTTRTTRPEPSTSRRQTRKQTALQTKTDDINAAKSQSEEEDEQNKQSRQKRARTGKGKAKTKASNTPAKKIASETSDNAIGEQEPHTVQDSSSDQPGHAMDVATESIQQEQEQLDDGSDVDEDIDWEAVDVPDHDMHEADQLEEEESKPSYQDVEVVFEAPRAVLKKSKWEMAYERGLREMLHNGHVVLLIAHYMVRNAWCSRRDVQAVCLSVVPDDIQSQVQDKDLSDLAFSKCVKQLLTWWRDYFKLTGTGLLTRAYDEYQFLDTFDWSSGNQPIQESLKARDLLDGENIASITDFAEKSASKTGMRDTSAELFVAILRALGFETRLVASLQPIPYRIPAKRPESDKSSAASKEEADQKAEEEAEGGEKKETTKKKLKFPMRKPRPRLNEEDSGNKLDAELKGKMAKPPTVWAEIFNPHTQKWITVDPIRTLYGNSRAMEPGANDRRNNMAYVLAFSDDLDGCIDVTQRYTPNMSKATRLRERELTKREKEGGMKLWWETFYPKIKRKNWTTREEKEQEELQHQQAREPMPTSIAAFNNHPLYALERHLKKFEIIHPREPVLGRIKGEPIYPRSCVKTVHTVETWMKFGRVIRDGEQPVKHVNARAVTAEKKRIQELAKQSGEVLQVGCYGEWQTEPYKPPPVVDGIVPRNAYGNVNLFTPEMLPEGAAHIPINGVAKIAKKLGIDYAEAIVDFEFVKKRSIPVMNGIVVAAENEEIILEAWAEHEQKEANKAIQRQEKEVFARWRKIILGVLIKARLDQDYAKEKEKEQQEHMSQGASSSTDISSIEKANESKWEEFLKNRHGKDSDDDKIAGGGFVRDEPGGGGFFEEEKDGWS